MSSVLQTAIHKTPYLLQTYKVCGPILSLRLFSDTFRAEQEGQLRSLLHLLQRGNEEHLKVVIVTVRWLWWPCTGTRAASTWVFLNCEYSQYVSLGVYLNENTWLMCSLMNTDKIEWYLRHTTFPLSPNIYRISVKNCIITFKRVPVDIFYML